MKKINYVKGRETVLAVIIYTYMALLSISPYVYTYYHRLFSYYFIGRFLYIIYVMTMFILYFKMNVKKWDYIVSLCWLIIVFLYIVSGIWNKNFQSLLFGLSIFVHIGFLMILMSNDRMSRLLLKAVLNFNSLYVIISFAFLFFFPSLLKPININGEGIIYKYGGISVNPQQFVMYLGEVFVYYIHLYRMQRVKVRFFIGMIPVLTLFFLTGSRTAFISLFVILFVYVIEYKPKINFGGLICIIICLFIIISFYDVIVKYLQIFFTRGSVKNFHTLGYRLIIWKYALKYIKDSPLIGYGYKGIGEVYLPFIKMKYFMPHNGYLRLIIDTGVISGAMMIIILIRTFYLYKKKIKYLKFNNMEKCRYVLLAFMLIVFGAISNFTESWFFRFGYPPTWAFWISIGLIAQKKNYGKGKSSVINKHNSTV